MVLRSPGNLLATREGDLCYLDFGMMSEAPEVCFLPAQSSAESSPCTQVPPLTASACVNRAKTCRCMHVQLPEEVTLHEYTLFLNVHSRECAWRAMQDARYAIIAHVVHLVNRDYQVSLLFHPHASSVLEASSSTFPSCAHTVLLRASCWGAMLVPIMHLDQTAQGSLG